MSLRKKAAIIGYGETGTGRLENKTPLDLCAESMQSALESADLERTDIDGLICRPSFVNFTDNYSELFADYVGLSLRYCDTGSLTSCSLIRDATMVISSGLAETVLCVGGDTILSNRAMFAKAVESHSRQEAFEAPYGLSGAPSRYALIARRHMHEFGTTSEQLAMIAVAERKNASLNPGAFKREPITVEDVLNSPMISDPFHLLDCSVVSDGGGAFIVTSAERAGKRRAPAVYVLGLGEYTSHEYLSPYTTTSGGSISGRKAFEMAMLAPKDVNLAYPYDSFTMTALMVLEQLGFCEKGQGGKFVENNDLSVNGNLPINTHGGLLSHAHAGGGGGIYHTTEAVRQLRGEAGSRQVKDAKVAVVHGAGGLIVNHCTAVLSNE